MNKNKYYQEGFLISYLGHKLGECVTTTKDSITFLYNDEYALDIRSNYVLINESLFNDNITLLYEILGYLSYHNFKFQIN